MSAEETSPILIVAGPTASGKSALAVDAAVEFNGVVINADSMQVYRDLRILTARPGPEDEARAPHKLFGVLPAADPCSAGRWLEMARDAVAEARGAGLLPVFAGGTGLYIRALMEGLADVPPIPAQVRKKARDLHARLGLEAFRDELSKVDPGAANELSGDSQRLIRAMEVALGTGETLAHWQRQTGGKPGVPGRYAALKLTPKREAIYRACDARFAGMIEAGALDEVRALLAQNLAPGLPVLKAVGVPELARYLSGETSLEEAQAKASQATRNYAKRQLTWLRHQLGDAETVSAQYSESIRPKIFSFIRQFLLTEGG